LTIFPEMFPGPLGFSLAGRALQKGVWSLAAVDIRGFARDRHGTVDDTPFGGGAGMVMRPDVLSDAIASVQTPDRPTLYLSPRGAPFDQARARALAAAPGVTLVCGRFEGVDERVIEAHGLEEVSVGDVVLSGGEIAALVVLDACVRLLPGVVGTATSLAEESFEEGLLEYPHYTRPASWTGPDGIERTVPEVLQTGHHARIAAWRRAAAEEITRRRRPDLWTRHEAARRAEELNDRGSERKGQES
jgi:tRNA (guanine37-N1)-methyltransferase